MKREKSRWWLLLMGIVVMAMAGCGGDTAVSEAGEEEASHEAEAEVLTLPALEAADLAGEPLQVVATTSIIGDVVGEIGGEAINLTTLMEPGQDPHSYEPAAANLTAVADAHLILVNGWNLEEGLSDDLATIGEEAPVVPVSAGIEPLSFSDEDAEEEGEDEHDDDHEDEQEDEHEGEHEEEHEHGPADPHVWLSVHNVEQWTHNIETLLVELDPAHAETYRANAARYREALAELDAYARAQVDAVPPERRVLVTNHRALTYFAHDYGFELLGAVIPGMSTVAEPAASELTALIGAMRGEGVCTIFSETTVSDRMAQTVAGELDHCEAVQVVPLYTGSLGPPGSGASSYLAMYRSNVDAIVSALR